MFPKNLGFSLLNLIFTFDQNAIRNKFQVSMIHSTGTYVVDIAIAIVIARFINLNGRPLSKRKINNYKHKFLRRYACHSVLQSWAVKAIFLLED